MGLLHSWMVGLAGGAVGTAAVIGLLTVQDTDRRVVDLTREVERARVDRTTTQQSLSAMQRVYEQELGSIRTGLNAAQSALSALAGRLDRIEQPLPPPPPLPQQRSQQVLDTLDRLNRGATGQPVPR